MNIQVHYERNGERHKIITDNRALGDIIVDNTGVPDEERGGTAKHLLAASTLYCYCSALVTAMEVRGLKYESLTANATLVLGDNENAQSRVLAIEIEVHVEINEDDFDLFERVQKVMRKGCLVTNSIHEGIEMNYKLLADIED